MVRRTAAKRSRRKKKSAKAPVKRVLIRLLGALFLTLMLFAAALFTWSFQAVEQSGDATIIHFEVSSSDRMSVVDGLARDGLVMNAILMKLYVGVLAPGASFSERHHLLRRGLSPRELVQRLAEVGSRERSKVVFPEGWTHLQMAKRLEAAEICSALGFQAAVHDSELLLELGIRKASAEGRLFPATYDFGVDTDPRQVVRRLVKESDERYSHLHSTLPPEPDLKRLGFGDEEIVILASIVEKETGVAAERARVARVFLNRLLDPAGETLGRLQSDPTAAYGCAVDPIDAPSCANYRGKVTPGMLSDAQNDYNTYRRAGLPPTAIANPGELSLRAVLAPARGDELYFVADGAGGHIFSTTFEEHQKAVQRLRLLRSASPNSPN